MRTILTLLVATAALSTAGEAMADAKNLSCITGISPNERRVIRDCGPEPQQIYHVHELFSEEPPPPPTPPLFMKNGEGGKGTRGREKDHAAPGGGGEPGGPSF